MTHTIPGGKEKGVELHAAGMDSLTYWSQRIGDAINKGESRFPDRDKKLHAALTAEIARREGGGAREVATSAKAPAGATAITTAAALDHLAGSHSEPVSVMQALREAETRAHLVTPQTSCPVLPPGCSVVFSVVHVSETDCYKLPGGKLGLDKTALDKIGAAAGVDWDPVLSRRLDTGRDPYYVHWCAVGVVRNFDGTERTICGNKEMDLRDGAPEAQESYQPDRNGKKPECDANGVPKSLVVKRKFIMGHAESKAKNRAIRSLGMRTSYDAKDLEKPFAIAKIMFTGQSNDPALRRMFAEKTADAFLGGRERLFGGGASSRNPTPGGARAIGSGAGPSAPHDPPPVGGQIDDDFSQYDEPESGAGQVVDSGSVPRDAVAAGQADLKL